MWTATNGIGGGTKGRRTIGEKLIEVYKAEEALRCEWVDRESRKDFLYCPRKYRWIQCSEPCALGGNHSKAGYKEPGTVLIIQDGELEQMKNQIRDFKRIRNIK